MPRKITKIVFALAATLLALLLVAVVSLGAWVMTGPKSLTKLLPYIEASLNPLQSPYQVQIDDALVIWEGWSEPMDFRLRGVGIRTQREGVELIKLNEISVGLDISSLLRFRLIPETIILRNPIMRFFREDDGRVYVGIGESFTQRVPLAMLLAGMNNEGTMADDTLIGSIRLISIEHAQISFGEQGENALFDAEDANLLIRCEENAVTAEMHIAMQYGDKPSQISGQARFTNQKDMLAAKMELLDISPHMFARLAPDVPELAELQLPLSGEVDLAVDNAGNLTMLDFRLQSTAGTFHHNTHFAEKLAVTKGVFEGQLRDNLKQIDIEKIELAFGDATLAVNGTAQRLDEGWVYDATALAQNMPVNDLYKYWPQTIAPTAYKWVTTHIREGNVPKATARFHLTAEQLGQPFPESAIDVAIQAKGAQVEYLPGHPKVQNVNGEVKFTGKGMTITSQSGAMLSGTVLKDAWLQIPELTAPTPHMQIKLAVDAPAKDVATYVGIPELNYAAPLGLVPETIEGQATAKMQFDFSLPSARSEDKNRHLQFLIDADITGGKQPDFMGNMNLTAADGKLTITHKTLDFNGTMAVSNAPLQVLLTHHFEPREYQTEYHANGVLAVPQLVAFGVPELPFLAGDVGLDAHIRRKKDGNAIKADVDLLNVAADIPEIGLTKKSGSKALLQFEAETTPDTLALTSFAITGDELLAKGSAKLGDKLKKLEKLHFDQLEFGDNNLTLAIDTQGEGYKIRAKGPSLDLKPQFDDEEKTPEPQPVEQKETELPFPIDLQAEFDWVVIGKERELRKVNARFVCSPKRCETADMQGVTGQSNAFSYQIKRVNNVRELHFTAQDAGSFLRAMDIFDNMVGGTITLRGKFNDEAAEHPFAGHVHVTEHTITNAPVLTKIASLLSLSGIGDALRGKGITFKKIESEVGYSKGIVSLKNGKAFGPSLGITVEEGTVNTLNKQIHISGTVVPSYTLNTALDNIPLIGEALTGGKGEGVFAATYKVEGRYPEETDVSVNPLTMLAPGFLRNIFGGGTEPEPAPDKVAAK